MVVRGVGGRGVGARGVGGRAVGVRGVGVGDGVCGEDWDGGGWGWEVWGLGCGVGGLGWGLGWGGGGGSLSLGLDPIQGKKQEVGEREGEGVRRGTEGGRGGVTEQRLPCQASSCVRPAQAELGPNLASPPTISPYQPTNYLVLDTKDQINLTRYVHYSTSYVIKNKKYTYTYIHTYIPGTKVYAWCNILRT